MNLFPNRSVVFPSPGNNSQIAGKSFSNGVILNQESLSYSLYFNEITKIKLRIQFIEAREFCFIYSEALMPNSRWKHFLKCDRSLNPTP
jgi:hypothetical protein